MTSRNIPASPRQPDWQTLLPICIRKAGVAQASDTSAGELLARFAAAGGAVKHGFHRHFGPLGWTDHKFIVLVVLLANEPKASIASELAHYAGVTRASMTQVLNRLESARWISRQRDRQDRRLILVELTASGRRAICAALAQYLELATRIVGALPPGDLPAFSRTIRHLHALADTLGHHTAATPARPSP
ncbi:MAG: MarR family transcriptional regulator [Verrucomicrobia bacterium]|nr:MarR family transcriptional regulator [Verrucomicrobiota bacterium]MBX3738527.1 MarR family transcriptional regulator [Candidatus Didemnitutus sp.]